MNKQYQNEILQVKALGEQIGYGNMMDIACALWREMLQKSGVAKEGAAIVTGLSSLKKHDRKRVESERNKRDKLILSLLKSLPDPAAENTPVPDERPIEIDADLLLRVLTNIVKNEPNNIGHKLIAPIFSNKGMVNLTFIGVKSNGPGFFCWAIEL